MKKVLCLSSILCVLFLRPYSKSAKEKLPWCEEPDSESNQMSPKYQNINIFKFRGEGGDGGRLLQKYPESQGRESKSAQLRVRQSECFLCVFTFVWNFDFSGPRHVSLARSRLISYKHIPLLIGVLLFFLITSSKLEIYLYTHKYAYHI